MPYAALIEMIFDTKEQAEDWIRIAEDLGYRKNGELEEQTVEEV